MVNPQNYFDFYDIFVNEISGGLYIFVALVIIFLIYWATLRYNVPWQVTAMLISLFFIIIGISTGNVIFLLISILLSCMFFFFAARAVKQG